MASLRLALQVAYRQVAERHSPEGSRLADILLVDMLPEADSPVAREARSLVEDNLAAEHTPEVVRILAADILAEVDTLEEVHSPAVGNLEARILEEHSLVAGNPAARSLVEGSPVEHIPGADNLVEHIPAAGNSLVDTDIRPADRGIPVAPDMVPAEFQVVVDYQRQASR